MRIERYYINENVLSARSAEEKYRFSVGFDRFSVSFDRFSVGFDRFSIGCYRFSIGF